MDELLAALVRAGIVDESVAQALTRMLNPTQQRMYAEQVLRAAVYDALQAQQQRILAVVSASEGNVSPGRWNEFWTLERGALFGAALPAMISVSSESLASAILQGGDVSNWQEIHSHIVDWVRDYYMNPDAGAFGSIPNLDAVSRQQFGEQFIAWQHGALRQVGYRDGLPDLIRAIEPIFGVDRAARIAATETTRIYAQVTQRMADGNDAVEHLRWFTAADEKVCPICGPLHGQARPKGRPYYIHPTLGQVRLPAHVNCRCWEGLETAATIELPFETQWRYQG